ncbi:hypothetical protein C8R43DRAFT_1117925 [Mycena crocata]|nr:hypothetical protein C8R43DRAFT_1117925 [Mycena crocata]
MPEDESLRFIIAHCALTGRDVPKIHCYSHPYSAPVPTFSLTDSETVEYGPNQGASNSFSTSAPSWVFGKTDGEEAERRWAELYPFTTPTNVMGPGVRQDTIHTIQAFRPHRPRIATESSKRPSDPVKKVPARGLSWLV